MILWSTCRTGGERPFALLLALTSAVSAVAPASPAATTGIPFRVYDSLLFLDKPDLSAFGLLPARGSGDLWSAHTSHTDVDEAAIRREVAPYRSFQGIYYVDIEDW